MTLFDRFLNTGARTKNRAQDASELLPPLSKEDFRTLPPFVPLQVSRNLAEFFQDQTTTIKEEVEQEEIQPVNDPLPARPHVLRLTPNHEAEQITTWIIEEIERRFRDGVVIIAGECIADGLDTERIDARVEHEAFRMLTKSPKRRAVLHRYITQKLVLKKRDLYVEHHLPYSLADQFQYYRIIDAATGAFTEPLAFLAIEQFTIENRHPLSQPPQRFYFPLISEETIIGRSESEALRDSTLSPGIGYVELPTAEGLSVNHLSIHVSDDGASLWMRYVGNPENRPFHFHNGEPIHERFQLTAPVVYGPSADTPYIRFYVFPARNPDEIKEIRSHQEAQVVDETDIDAILSRIDDYENAEDNAPTGDTDGSKPVEALLSRDLDATVVLSPPALYDPPPAPEAKPHHLLHVSVHTRTEPDEDYEVIFNETYPLTASKVVVGRDPRTDDQEPDTQYVQIRLKDTTPDLIRTISRRHFLLVFKDSSAYARELSTRNHVYVCSNGQRRHLDNTDLELLPARTFFIEGRLAGQKPDIQVVFEISELNQS